MFIGKMFFKATGIMSKRMRMNTCTKLGEKLTQKVITTGEKVNVDDVSVFLKDVMGKRMKGVKVSTDPKDVCEFAVKELDIPEAAAKSLVDGVLSSVWSSLKTGKSLLDLRIQNMNPSEAINTAVHETQHLLNRTTSLSAKWNSLITKLFPKKVEKITKEYGTVLNLKSQSLQGDLLYSLGINQSNVGYVDDTAMNTLLKSFECKNIAELREILRNMIREDVIIPGCDKKNSKILKAITLLFKDEANSYKAGGKAEKYFDMATGQRMQGETKSETFAKLYEETLPVLKSETRKQRLNNIKKFFGLKPKEYAIVPDFNECTLHQEEVQSLISKGYFNNENEVIEVLTAIKEVMSGG